MIQSLPVELIGKIVGELSLEDAIKVSQLSRRMNAVGSDTILNVWRLPILRNLRSEEYEDSLKHLSVYMSVPRHNWVEICALGRASYLLFEMTLPNLKEADWEDAFKKRFLPSWRRWRKDGTWKAAFLRFRVFCGASNSRVLHQTWHRSCTSCTANESWTKYIVLNRNGSANQLEASSRNFNPTVIFNDLRVQQNTHRLEMRARLVVQFADVRVIALGTLNRPRSSLTVNPNAKAFLHPPGVAPDTAAIKDYSSLKYPLPAQTHINYPFYTPGGGDKRWIMPEDSEEAGLEWIGGLMIVAQILGQGINDASTTHGWPPFQDGDLLVGPGRQQYVSLTWDDLWAIAPWLEEKITRRIDGPGLGI
ncbi:hypothetical protein B0H16DRAFT_1658683 [Mycena metata]|uniref:F-box domain-containing protein n=1 Tax=Mycena metata TaxID=1033252 RepID=A0AAD7K9A7_9AGAR|nr:hypothetical protein B0H16DRAFT_1658683 [Mycena metata]